MAEKPSTRRLILEAAVTCIEKYGIDKVTTRKIAVEAGTNIASINYYFRSKDELIAETLSMTITHMMEDVLMSIDDASVPFQQVLSNVVFYLLDGSRQFPGISRAHLYKAVVEQDRQSSSAQVMVKVFERLVQRAVREVPDKDPKQVRLAMSQIFSSILLSLLSPGFLPLPRAYQVTNSKKARLVADCYAAQFAAMIQAGSCP